MENSARCSTKDEVPDAAVSKASHHHQTNSDFFDTALKRVGDRELTGLDIFDGGSELMFREMVCQSPPDILVRQRLPIADAA